MNGIILIPMSCILKAFFFLERNTSMQNLTIKIKPNYKNNKNLPFQAQANQNKFIFDIQRQYFELYDSF